MRGIIWVLFPVVLLLNACVQQQDKVETTAYLPIQLKEGYGPFHPGFSLISNTSKDSPVWGKTYLSVKGIPKSWSTTSISHIWLNTHQFVYQNYIAGSISLADYQGLKKSWHWLPDTSKLSKKPIRCYLYVIRGFNEKSGKWTVRVDTNNNLDFSDETSLYPDVMNSEDPYQYTKPLQIQYDVYQKGEVHEAELPMILKMYGSELLYNFPQYATTSFGKEGKEYQIVLASSFTRPDYETTSLIDPSTLFFSKKIDPNDLIEINDVIEIGGVKYKNKGVDVFNNWLELEPLNGEKQLYTLQVGNYFTPFANQQSVTGRTIDFAKYRGKFVYIDFWATWCKGCVADMPALVTIYQKVDTSKVVFVGIAKDSPKRVNDFMKKLPIPWSQLIDDDRNKLSEIYHITGLPTSVLVNPKGIIIARNIRPDQLRVALTKQLIR